MWCNACLHEQENCVPRISEDFGKYQIWSWWMVIIFLAPVFKEVWNVNKSSHVTQNGQRLSSTQERCHCPCDTLVTTADQSYILVSLSRLLPTAVCREPVWQSFRDIVVECLSWSAFGQVKPTIKISFFESLLFRGEHLVDQDEPISVFDHDNAVSVRWARDLDLFTRHQVNFPIPLIRLRLLCNIQEWRCSLLLDGVP
jgi:hypothetical protein